MTLAIVSPVDSITLATNAGVTPSCGKTGSYMVTYFGEHGSERVGGGTHEYITWTCRAWLTGATVDAVLQAFRELSDCLLGMDGSSSSSVSYTPIGGTPITLSGVVSREDLATNGEYGYLPGSSLVYLPVSFTIAQVSNE